jgi:rod shape determining protein RodA
MVGTALLLTFVGLAMMFSASSEDALFSARFIRQAISVSIAFCLFIIVSAFPYHSLRRYAIPLYMLGLFGLVIVSQAGRVVRGTVSRLELFGVQIQPSEFIKIALIILLAWFFARKKVINLSVVIYSAIIVGSAAILVILEPDIGEAALIITLWIAMMIFIGTPWRYLFTVGFLGIIGFWATWHWLFAEYQKARIATFIDPTSDPLGAGYNIMQSIVAFGSGGLLGRGLGHGPQSQLKFLPEQHTDFILASIGEELGFVGVALVFSLYTILLWRILKVARTTRDPFGQYLAVGGFIMLLTSFFVSTGMNMGLLPVTGIPLPLVSFGGSNMVSTFIMLAIIQSIHIHGKWVQRPPSEITHLT